MKKRDDTTDSNIITLLWRTGWDSNPRAGVTDKRVSSAPRYDHFDTCPYISKLLSKFKANIKFY